MSQLNLENLASLVTYRPASPLPPSHETNDHEESFGHQLEQAQEAVAPSSTDEHSESPRNKTDQHEASEETIEQPTSSDSEPLLCQSTKEESDQKPLDDEYDPENRTEPVLDLSQFQETSDEPEVKQTVEPTTVLAEEITDEIKDGNTPFNEPESNEIESIVVEKSEQSVSQVTPTAVPDGKEDALVLPTESRASEPSFVEPPDAINDTVEEHRGSEVQIEPKTAPRDAEIPKSEVTENPETQSLLPTFDVQTADDKESQQHIQPGVEPVEQDIAQPTNELQSQDPTDEKRIPETRPTTDPERLTPEPEVATTSVQSIESSSPIVVSPDGTVDTSNASIGVIPVDSIQPKTLNDPTAESHTPDPRPIGPTGVESNVAIEPSSSIEGASNRTTHDSAVRELDKAPTTERGRFIHRVTRAFQAVGNRSGTIRMQLHPPELGSLRLELTVRNGMLHAQLETETSAARNLLLDNLPALRQRLAEQEIKVEQFNVDVSDRQTGGSHHSPGNQSRSSGQGDSRDPGNESPSVESGESSGTERTGQRNDPTSFDVSI